MARRNFLALFAVLALYVQFSAAFGSDQLKKIIAGKEPFRTVEDIQAFEARLQEISKVVVPATVGIRIGGASGSGVIINKEGHILTAGHVSGAAGREAVIVLHDGKRLKAKTLGANRDIDSGLMIITSELEEDLPFVEMGDSKGLSRGQWCIATGHPGGYSPGRTPPVRCGRVLRTGNETVLTDCPLIGGDSGGPLFDFDGKVIGINSRIGGLLNQNIHVPVATYKATWDRLSASEVWGNKIGTQGRGRRGSASVPPLKKGDPVIGVIEVIGAKQAKIGRVDKDSPAAKAGLQPNDVIEKFNEKAISNFTDLAAKVRASKPGAEVQLAVIRGKKNLKLKIVIGKHK